MTDAKQLLINDRFDIFFGVLDYSLNSQKQFNIMLDRV
jgi:hypothetical protein